MYVDGVVLMAEPELELQDLLSVVQDWMLKWHISLNLKSLNTSILNPKLSNKQNLTSKLITNLLR